MKPIYFPFTYLSPPIFDVLEAIFGHIAVYQPLARMVPETLKEWTENGGLDIRVPATENENELVDLLQEYRIWADLHPPSQRAFYKFQRDVIPFSSDTQVSNIQSEIRRLSQGKRKEIRSDPLLIARLFLLLAQEFDVQEYELQTAFHSIEKQEQQLFDTIKGEDLFHHTAGTDVKANGIQNQPDDMISERLKAWYRLMQQDPEDSALYVTSSRDAFQRIIDSIPSAEAVAGFSAASIPYAADTPGKDWTQNFTGYLVTLAETDWPPKTENRFPMLNFSRDKSVLFTLYVAPHTVPQELFARVTEQEPPRFHGKRRFRNTLVGLVEI